jgi:hypothetical protein
MKHVALRKANPKTIIKIESPMNNPICGTTILVVVPCLTHQFAETSVEIASFSLLTPSLLPLSQLVRVQLRCSFLCEVFSSIHEIFLQFILDGRR